MRSAISILRVGLLLLLAPAVLLSNRPINGCICPDGHFEQNCPRMRVHVETAPGSCCGCSCCKDRKSCCESTCKSCCHSDRNRKPTGPEFTRSTCSPAMLSVAVPAVVKVLKNGVDDSAPLLFDLPALDSVIARSQTGRYVPFDIDTGPPPTDLVMVLRHLLI